MSTSLHRRLSLVLQSVLLVETFLALFRQQWFTAFVCGAVFLITLVPLLLAKQLRVHIPAQFQLIAVAMAFAALFLGEVRDFYTRFWWWDSALHLAAGFVLGIVGFLLVHILNEMEDVGIYMKPGFVALFSFMFALGTGALWELFEFCMDQFFGMNLQKPMLDDPSGLTDTMVDLMVDALGAFLVCSYGFVHLRSPDRRTIVGKWISIFIRKNPRFFRRHQPGARATRQSNGEGESGG